MAERDINIQDIAQYIGHEFGRSKWIEINQNRVNKFAEATGNFQWMHVDEEQARTELVSGKTIVPNYLLLSLVPSLFDHIISFSGLSYGQNKGADSIKFLEPVRTGSRVSIRLKLSALDRLDEKNRMANFYIVMEKEWCNSPVLTMNLKLLLVKRQNNTSTLMEKTILPDYHQSVALGF